jgi:hypothetical protein
MAAAGLQPHVQVLGGCVGHLPEACQGHHRASCLHVLRLVQRRSRLAMVLFNACPAGTLLVDTPSRCPLSMRCVPLGAVFMCMLMPMYVQASSAVHEWQPSSAVQLPGAGIMHHSAVMCVSAWHPHLTGAQLECWVIGPACVVHMQGWEVVQAM